MLEARNSKKQGDIGVGLAIAWCAKRGYTVCIPLTDSQEYDLVIEMPEGLKRFQVKTTRHIARRLPHHNGAYSADLRTKGTNRGQTVTTKRLDVTQVDYVFIVTDANDIYLIPSSELKGLSKVQLGAHYQQYKTEL